MLENEGATAAQQKRKATLTRLGVVLIIVSCIFYAAILLVPLSSFSTGTKVAVTGGLVIAGEATFWIGGIILGKEAVTRYRKSLNPMNWFKSGVQKKD
ncbi:transporter suffix domain-containing protein [Neobacillus sp. YIM B06451]|uniref:transporter suffix domain-containing protein n=1 Tax=Neobacillus sp. YIM B06451 TaxID=3070994 RepID=UPI00292F1588|nr:transporter suffix domain-containing protein [Neobacillus sp. YIM B06451]